jgi:hypothetical protein
MRHPSLSSTRDRSTDPAVRSRFRIMAHCTEIKWTICHPILPGPKGIGSIPSLITTPISIRPSHSGPSI